MSLLVGDLEKTTPMTTPSGSTSGPPEFPGRTRAWITYTSRTDGFSP